MTPGPAIPRDNNFDLIRLFAAMQVVLFHTSVHLKAEMPEAVARVLALFPGVPVFFYISGLLVTSSLMARGDLRRYAAARFRRVFPALWLAFALAFVILLGFGQIELNAQLAAWVLSQVTVFQVYHPEMFRDFGVGVVNGSLWTIPVEIGFYCILPILIWVGRGRRGLTALLIAAAVASFTLHRLVSDREEFLYRLMDVTPLTHLWLFAGGVLTYLYFDRIAPIARRFWAAPLIVYLAFGLLAAPHLTPTAAEAIGAPMLMASVLSLGLAPSIVGVLRGYDISYGIYLFHMLAVNVLIELGWFGPMAALAAIVSTVLTAMLSWRFLESRVLKRADPRVAP